VKPIGCRDTLSPAMSARVSIRVVQPPHALLRVDCATACTIGQILDSLKRAPHRLANLCLFHGGRALTAELQISSLLDSASAVTLVGSNSLVHIMKTHAAWIISSTPYSFNCAISFHTATMLNLSSRAQRPQLQFQSKTKRPRARRSRMRHIHPHHQRRPSLSQSLWHPAALDLQRCPPPLRPSLLP
jgi:hypothetical protein